MDTRRNIDYTEPMNDNDYSKSTSSSTNPPLNGSFKSAQLTSKANYQSSDIYDRRQYHVTEDSFDQHQLIPPISPNSNINVNTLSAVLSRIHLSYTDDNDINMEANITTVSELWSLVDIFGKLSYTTTITSETPSTTSDSCTPGRQNSMVLYRNKSCITAPVNYPQMVGLLGRMLHPHPSHHGMITLRQMADICVDTYFACGIRFPPVLQRRDFMEWYLTHDAPQDTLIVNALCALVLRHIITHHCPPVLHHLLYDPDLVQQQEEFFFNRARDALAQCFDSPDRFTIIALAILSARADSGRRHHYNGLAISLLQQFGIYPRMTTDTNHSDANGNDDISPYDLEMNTRLWWFVWQVDFSHWTSGSSKITPLLRHPNQRYEDVDLPMVFEQDIDGNEVAVVIQAHALTFWRIQANIIDTMYEQESDLTSEQLLNFDEQLKDYYYNQIPSSLKWHNNKSNSNSKDMEGARIRIRVEYNASRIILHKPFVPDIGDMQPSQEAMISLNICIRVTLEQLDMLEKCLEPSLRCNFDLFELWRVGQILSMAMDIYRTINDDDNNKVDYLRHHLERTINVLERTPECMVGTKPWVKVADFLHIELRRHGTCTKISPSPETLPLQQLLGQQPLVGLSSPLSNNGKETLNRQHSGAATTTKPRSDVQVTCMNTSITKNYKTRFRYFNPRKMDKLLFIDDSPF
ncbi:hypothetical protein BC941DRAFT_101405 [Chlamydoabsidia padenii]|nr:hypothetical protein BC941DRAFT_101405 [Chlamydoabsidia padenii]